MPSRNTPASPPVTGGVGASCPRNPARDMLLLLFKNNKLLFSAGPETLFFEKNIPLEL